MQYSTMQKNLILLLLVVMMAACSGSSNEQAAPSGEKYLSFVDPMIGTGGTGHTFPGATTPFGMVQLSPSNEYKSWDYCSGYHYNDTIVKGFAHTHISGPGLSGLGDILVMPARETHTNSGEDGKADTGYRARFSHDNESASAGYYKLLLHEEEVLVELTAGTRMGYHRYTFNGEGEDYLLFDPNHQINENIQDTYLELISDTELVGYKDCDGWSAGDRTQYFYAKFSQPVAGFNLVRKGEPVEGNKGNGKGLLGQVRFDLAPGESVEVHLALSSISIEGAKANFEAEAVDGFDLAHENARREWAKVLSKIEIEGATDRQMKLFYTGLYHAFISPNLISDADGRYYVEGKVRQSDIPQYSNFSTWDTYRGLHPLFTIIETEKTAEFVNSLSSRVAVDDVGLPSWECLGYDNRCMIGYSAVSPVADAVLKDIPGVDVDAAYEAIRYAAFDRTKHSQVSDLNGMDEYLKYGYVTAETGVSVSKTTEQNYCDWAIARVAEKLGKTKDQTLFDRRAIGYRNFFDPQTGYFMPITATGEHLLLDTTKWNSLKGHYISGNIWAYSAYSPHDMKGVMQLHGGREAYAQWLQGVFQNESPLEGHQHVDISGFIGKYGHGDEPGHHMPYLFNYVGKPWLAQRYINEVLTTMYHPNPQEGFINNEDLGQMSAWYMLSALGMYQVAPGDGIFQLTAPLHPKAVIHLESGDDFTILANNVSTENIYVQSVTLNGQSYDKNYIDYKTIMQGGELVFELGPEPNKQWGSAPAATFPGDFEDTAVAEIPVVGTPAPYDVAPGAFFRTERTIELASKNKDAKIYYTLDGSEPDDSSTPYNGPFTIRENTTVKAIAYEEGLNPSAFFEKPYYQSVLAGLPAGYPKYSVSQHDFPYGKEGAELIFDQEIGSESYNDNRWTGIKDNIFLDIDFGEPTSVKELEVGALKDTQSYIFPPDKIEVLAGNQPGALQPIGSLDLPPQEGHELKVYRYKLDLEPGQYRYVKVKVYNYGAPPEWHGARGNELWTFLDEVILN